ncbi:MAG: biotin synthase-related radical SAM superfamily protein [Paraglaciecola sp.]
MRRKLKRGKGDKKKREEELVKAVIEEAVKTEFLEEITEGDMRTDSIAMEEEAVEKKVKITTKYYVVVRSIIQYEDATTEDKTWKYEVKNVKSRADESARLDEEKYQWELITAKGKLIYICI